MENKELDKKEKKSNVFHFYTFGLMRRLYNWVLSWAESKYSTIALFVLAFIESSFFPIPPDVLLMPLSLSKQKKAWFYATVCTVGSVLGGIFGWFIGHSLYETVGKKIIESLHYQAEFALVGQYYQSNAWFYIFAAALTPIPYKVFTIAAGVWSIGIPTLISASIIGRGLRFFGVSALLYFFGARIKEFIEKYFEWLAMLALVLLVGGFYAIKYLM